MRVLIAAGGTAGHINPALAIAGAIKKADPSAEIHFAGRKEGMEYRLVTQAGYPFHHIEITGFQRRLSLNNIKRNIITLWNLALSGPKARAMMKEVQPDLVIGCGGYVSGPIVRAAARKGIKTAIHVAGLTIVAILMVVSIIIIANTVRVTIFNRRREINIMKYVGATNAFIRFPFLVEGMVIGLISALIAFGLLWVGTHFLYQWVGQSASGWLQLAYQSLIPFGSIAPQMLLGFAGAGVLFGMVGSFIFVGKYLKV